jgi:hypothetical protein
MQTELANAKTTAALQQRHDLLDAWLTALNQLDPMRRRAAQIAPQQIRQASATIPAIFNRANLRPVEYPQATRLRSLE